MHSIPTWLFSETGGVWIETLSNNYLFLIPYRFVGYLVASTTNISPNLIYKLSFLFLGQGIFLFGIYRLARHFFKSHLYSLLIVLAALFSSLIVTNLNHEHALATVFYLPFGWLFFLESPKKPAYLIVVATLVGLSLTCHYPQLQFGYGLCLFLAVLVSGKPAWNYLKRKFSYLKSALGIRIIVFSIAALLLSASPLLYTYASYGDKLESPFRGQEQTILADDYNEYVKMNTRFSSITPMNFEQYFNYQHGGYFKYGSHG